MPQLSLKDLALTMARIADLQEIHLPLLKKLLFHHRSQAKDKSPPVSKRYNAELAEEIQKVIDLFDK